MIKATDLEEELWISSLSNFTCDRDQEITDFIRNKAIEYEKRDKCRTYLYFDDSLLQETNILRVMGFFSVEMKSINISPQLSISNRLKRRLGNLSDNNGNIVTYLIGQLGKDSTYQQSISGLKMLQDCFDLISDIRENIGGRLILLESKPVPKLCQYYENQGFVDITEDDNDGFRRYIKFIT